MSPAECARNRRFKSAPLRNAHSITRALLRTVLSHYSDCPPTRWEFAEAAHGKPYISSPTTSLNFNLSHSTEWIACAIADFPLLGIDVERTGRDVAILRLAKRFFSRREYEDVKKLAGAARKNRFFDYWTLKESYIKARGEGISLGLDKFSFGIADRGNITIECDEQLQDEPRAWQFWLSAGEGDHRLALAAKPPEPRAIAVRHFITIPRHGTETYSGPLLLRERV